MIEIDSHPTEGTPWDGLENWFYDGEVDATWVLSWDIDE